MLINLQEKHLQTYREEKEGRERCRTRLLAPAQVTHCPKWPAPGHRHAQSHGFSQALISLSLLHSQQQPLRADKPMLLALFWGTSTGCLLFLYSSSMNTAPSGLPVWPLWRQPAHLCQETAGCDPASDTRALICHQSSLMEKVSLPPFLPPSTLYLVPCKEHPYTCL